MSKSKLVKIADKLTMEHLDSSIFAKNPTEYVILLRKGKKKLYIPNINNKKRLPSKTTVLDTLIEDSILYFGSGSFGNLCIQCNWDPTDPVSETQYNQFKWFSEGIKELLGDKLYEEAVAAWKEKHASASLPKSCI